MSEKLTVLARIKAKPGLEEQVKKVLLALVPQTRAETGCINYDLHQSQDDKTLFLFYENWVSRQALDQHLAMPYLVDFIAQADQLLAEPLDIAFWEMISQP